MELNLEYGELFKDKDFVNNCENLKENLVEVQKVLEKLMPLRERYDELSRPEKIELDLFLLYALNSLHWIHLRIQGIDPTQHRIKDELQRIKATMLRWQEVKDRALRPTVNIDVATRFVRNGLYDPHARRETPPNKKIKFDDDGEVVKGR